MTDVAGWIVCTALFALLIVQMKNAESFRKLAPSSAHAADGPAVNVSVLVHAESGDQFLEESLRTLLAQDLKPAELLVSLNGPEDGPGSVVRALSAVHQHVTLVTLEPAPDGWTYQEWTRAQLSKAATGDFLLLARADTLHEPDALSRAMHRLLEEDLDVLSVLPLQRPGGPLEHMILPLHRFFFVTFLPPLLSRQRAAARIDQASEQYLLFRRSGYDAIAADQQIGDSGGAGRDGTRRAMEVRLRVGLADGAGAMECKRDRSGVGLSQILFQGIGRTRLWSAASAAGLLVLFTLPPLIAVTTSSFPWLIASVVGLWLRLRSDVRGGYGIAWALLHPLSVALAVAILIRFTQRSSGGEHKVK